MYGLVHKAARSAVLKASNLSTWNDILSDAGQTELVVLSADHYPDELTLELVAAIARKFGKTQEDTLRLFGEHWVEFISAEGYNSILMHAGSSLVSFLINLDRMHSSLSVTLPKAVMPSFEVVSSSSTVIEVIYRSERQGLETFVEGIFIGLCEFYKEDVDISFQVEEDGARFVLNRNLNSNKYPDTASQTHQEKPEAVLPSKERLLTDA